jgi:EAL domain-containing protein (putative c-di-GMP-specific phosphodiesterase class I)
VQIAEPISIAGYELFVTASIGIAQFPDHGADVDHLLRHADAAMYEAKRLGKNQFRFFTEELHAASFEKLSLEKELRRAIERDQFVLHYQPKVDAQTLAINGVEALIRWQHPEWGLVPPSRFIPVAEEAGLIVAIGDWVLSAACRQVAAWRDAGLPPVTVAVNLASPSFRVPNLARQIGAELARWRLSPASLVIEVTESLLMHDVEAAIAVLHELRALGVRLAIDDFGTGYSSLSYLMRFPIDQLKVDQSFVRHLEESRDHAAIAKAVISLGRALEIETVAEGVETTAQAARLIALRCTTLQGYLFARPMPADDVTRLLRLPAPFAELHGALRAVEAPRVIETVM